MGVTSIVAGGTVLEGSIVGDTVGWIGEIVGSVTDVCDGELSIRFKVQPEADAMPSTAMHAEMRMRVRFLRIGCAVINRLPWAGWVCAIFLDTIRCRCNYCTAHQFENNTRQPAKSLASVYKNAIRVNYL